MKNAVTLAILLISLEAFALGDLLLTVKERSAINIVRENGITEIGEGMLVDKIKVNGFYFNSHDKRETAQVWVNGKLADGEVVTKGVRLKRVNERDKTAFLILDKTQSSIPVRAGQTLQLDNGQISDPFE